ncbi:MAG: ECF-type sigma factor [Planctomycetaceae bacterium]
MSDFDAEQSLERWRSGDQAAASEIFQQYVTRLIGLARNRLSARMSKRIDPEDVVQSAYRSFFRNAREDRYTLSRSGDLWKLLAAITVKKVHGQVEHHTAQKRAIHREQADPDDNELCGVHPEMVSREPSPTEALTVVEQLEEIMQGLSSEHRKILELRLQENTIEEVAEEVGCSERTVRRVLDRVREKLSRDANSA